MKKPWQEKNQYLHKLTQQAVELEFTVQTA